MGCVLMYCNYINFNIILPILFINTICTALHTDQNARDARFIHSHIVTPWWPVAIFSRECISDPITISLNSHVLMILGNH